MPFTVTHIAAIIPLAWLSRWRLPFSALALGSMVPDIAGYYPAIIDYRTSHSAIGVLTHCTPIGVVLYYTYQAFLKQPFFDLFPNAVTTRMRPWIDHPVNLTVSGVLTVMGCVWLGAMTHFLWDSVTHRGGWGAASFPMLTESLVKVSGRSIRWFEFLQHSSSLLLLPMLIGFSLWLRTRPPQDDPVERARFPKAIAWCVLAAVAIGGAMYLPYASANQPRVNWLALLTSTVKSCGTITLSLFLIYSLGMNLLWWHERKRPPHIVDDTIRSW